MKRLTEKIRIKTMPKKEAHIRVMIIYTGGTFGMVPRADKALIPFDFTHTLAYLPVLKRMALDISVISFTKPVDSTNIQPEHWRRIGKVIFDNYAQQDGFVVLHGTDTMAYTASALAFMLPHIGKPVIFTGSQLPISTPRSDGRENLVGALEIASAYKDGKPRVPEVGLYFNYELHRGCRAKKIQSLYFDAFHSANRLLLARVGTRISYMDKMIRPASAMPITLLSRFDTRIALLKLFPGIDEKYVRAVVGMSELRGIILETYGSGNAITATWFKSLIRQAVENGVLVVNISQCISGHVYQGKYRTSKWLSAAGVISGHDMTLEAATTKLMLLLGEYGVEEAKKRMGVSLAGEIDEEAGKE